jgi:hypothetical protein
MPTTLTMPTAVAAQRRLLAERAERLLVDSAIDRAAVAIAEAFARR